MRTLQGEPADREARWTTSVRFAIAADSREAAQAVANQILPRLELPLAREPTVQPLGGPDGVWVATAQPDLTALAGVEPDNAQTRCSYIGGHFGEGVLWTERVTDVQGKWIWPPDIWSRRPGKDDVLINRALLAVIIWVEAKQAAA
jgi:hypothetical protein